MKGGKNETGCLRFHYITPTNYINAFLKNYIILYILTYFTVIYFISLSTINIGITIEAVITIKKTINNAKR